MSSNHGNTVEQMLSGDVVLELHAKTNDLIAKSGNIARDGHDKVKSLGKQATQWIIEKSQLQ